MILVATGARIVGAKKSTFAVAIVQLSQISRVGGDVVARIIRICTQTVAESKLSP
jgi:hypothetical protein